MRLLESALAPDLQADSVLPKAPPKKQKYERIPKTRPQPENACAGND